ncbi:hypothetical protein E1A91_A05G321000v1 [Gossypium mustelinum]|uniref:Uncharacterized protein n=1 Tax=Gossypium mustelinum TaxID=34275 RepID=A0A5D2ZDG1_GOSMU|nr:hypothetical protein E1A91_A05G321000v1 [Gossypium mustelinum]
MELTQPFYCLQKEIECLSKILDYESNMGHVPFCCKYQPLRSEDLASPFYGRLWYVIQTRYNHKIQNIWWR